MYMYFLKIFFFFIFITNYKLFCYCNNKIACVDLIKIINSIDSSILFKKNILKTINKDDYLFKKKIKILHNELNNLYSSINNIDFLNKEIKKNKIIRRLKKLKEIYELKKINNIKKYKKKISLNIYKINFILDIISKSNNYSFVFNKNNSFVIYNTNYIDISDEVILIFNNYF